MKTVEITCDFCDKKIQKTNSELKRYSNHFCSQKCNRQHQVMGDTIKTTCFNCNKEITRQKSQATKSKTGNYFCSKSCAATFNNKLKRKSLRSKIEIKLYNSLVKEFPNLNILPNDKTMLDGLEIDIAIPELKLGIEWNGIVHFKPIYGQDKLNKIQSKDAEKLKIASNKDINLIVIPDLVSNDKILKQAFNNIKSIIRDLIKNIKMGNGGIEPLDSHLA